MNPLHGLASQGQSVWFDDLQRSLIWTGRLHHMLQHDGLKGASSHPRLLEDAVQGSDDYFWALAALVTDGCDVGECYEHLVIEDVQWACDMLRGLYDGTEGRDGFCSLGLSPYVLLDPVEILDEANRLWDLVGRDNLMLRVPATQAGLTILPDLIAQGINVNVTLIFSAERYLSVHQAYLKGIEELLRAGGDPSMVASVASFYVSRIDAMVDAQIDAQLANSEPSERGAMLRPLRGQGAIASAKLAYRAFEETISSDRWSILAAQGARPQRLLWTSTSTKDPAFRDVRYVESLIGPETVVAMAAPTYGAFIDHGQVAATLQTGLADAEAVVAALDEVGVSLVETATTLEEEGLQALIDDHERLMVVLQRARSMIMGDHQSPAHLQLGAFDSAVEDRLQTLSDIGFVRRLWGRDSTLFGENDENEASERVMSWLDIVDFMEMDIAPLLHFQSQLKTEETESVVILGGSTSIASMFVRVFGQFDGSPELLVLDGTVPAQVRSIEEDITPEETLFVVSAKSSLSNEVAAVEGYFYDQLKSGDQFVALTDPGSPVEELAVERDYRAVYSTEPDVAEPFSALSSLGLLPAAAMGLDIEELLERARFMVASCSESVPASDNPGIRLGVALAELALAGRNKLTFITSPGLTGFELWLEELVTVSTAQGVVPVCGEPLAPPDRYRDDRAFVYISLKDDDEEVSDHIEALEAAGHPVLTFRLSDPRDLVQEIFRWQVGGATVGHILGVNPFALPDHSHREHRISALLERYAQDQELDLPDVVRVAESDGLIAYADAGNVRAFSEGQSVQDVLRAHLGRLEPGDYVAINAFIERSETAEVVLQQIRCTIRDHYRAATTLGFGPRHSTLTEREDGKPEAGLFIHITADVPADLPVPGRSHSFGVLSSALQSEDLQALSRRSSRALQVHLGVDALAGLDVLGRLLTNH